MGSKTVSRFTIIRDTREKKGHGWWFDEDAYCIGTEAIKLDIGDYSIKDKEHVLCIERKESVTELAGNCGEKRFLEQLKKMSSFPYAFLLLEFTWDSIYNYPIGTNIPLDKINKVKIKGEYIMRVLTSAQIEHSIHVIACGNQMRAEQIAFRIMRHVNDL